MLLSLAITGCLPEEPGRDVQTADAVACLALPDGVSAPAGEEREYLVDGVATASSSAEGIVFTDGVRCDQASRRLTITDPDGGEWHVGYGWTDAGRDVTPALAVLPGGEVSLVFRSVEGTGGTAAGFVVREAGHVFAAIEVGAWGPALRPSDVDEVVVGEGEVVGSEPDPCGRRVSREVRFVGDEEVLVEPVDDAILRADGSDFTAWALASWAWEDPTCTDVSGELSWALWRDAP